MGDLGFDPETALKLIQTLLRGAAYFFAGFALLGLSACVVFLCREIFASRPRAKVRFTKVLPMGCASVVEQDRDMIFPETPILVASESLGEEAVRVTAPLRGASSGDGSCPQSVR